MNTLTLSTAAHKAALISAIEHQLEVTEDNIGSDASELQYAEDVEFDIVLTSINASRKQVAFMEAFLKGLTDVPVGISVFLEELEVAVVKEALASLVDVESDDESPLSLDEVFSVYNIKQSILKTNTSWGSLDVDALSRDLSNQARQTVDENSPAQDLLNSLN